MNNIYNIILLRIILYCTIVYNTKLIFKVTEIKSVFTKRYNTNLIFLMNKIIKIQIK